MKPFILYGDNVSEDVKARVRSVIPARFGVEFRPLPAVLGGLPTSVDAAARDPEEEAPMDAETARLALTDEQRRSLDLLELLKLCGVTWRPVDDACLINTFHDPSGRMIFGGTVTTAWDWLHHGWVNSCGGCERCEVAA